MNTIWVFGCSFSSGHSGVPQESTYGNLLAKELNYNIKNLSSAGASNDILFYRFNQNLNNLKDGDIVLYQFTGFNRIGFFDDDTDDSYFSSTGLPELGIDTKRNDGPFSTKTDREIEILLDYILTWQSKRYRFTYNDTINLMHFLIKNKNIKIHTLYLFDEFSKRDENVIKLPTINNPKNTSLNEYFMSNKLTVYDEDPIKYFMDSHPSFSGHNKLKELIKNKINGR